MATITERFLAFCRQFPGSEDIDALPITTAQNRNQLKKADFLFENRSIICEVKTLEQDPTTKLENVMADYGIHPSTLAPGQHVVEDLFGRLPKGQNLYRRTVKKITKAIDKGLDSATRQIHDTKRLFDLSNADGLVVMLNGDIQLLNPIIFEERLRLALQKTTSGGQPYHSDITYVFYIMEASHVVAPDGAASALHTYYDNSPVHDNNNARRFILQLAQAWANFNGNTFQTADGNDQLYDLMRTSKLVVNVR